MMINDVAPYVWEALGWLWLIDSHIVAVVCAMVLCATFNGVYLNGENLFREWFVFTMGVVFLWKWVLVLLGMVYR